MKRAISARCKLNRTRGSCSRKGSGKRSQKWPGEILRQMIVQDRIAAIGLLNFYLNRKYDMTSIDYMVRLDSLVYAQYVNKLAILAMQNGKSKTLNIVTKIMPGGAAVVWFEVVSFDKNKDGQKEQTNTYVTLESALKVYNEIRVD